LELKKKEALELDDKIKLLKEVHQKRQQRRLKQKTLGDSDSEEEDDALSWVQKYKKVREEKVLAVKRASLLAEIEAEEKGSDSEHDPVALRLEKRKQYPTAVVEGVTILHNVNEFQEGETILTLTDSKIVVDGKINDEDELEAPNLVENAKLKKFNDIRAGKRKYDVYGDDQNEILPQYDEDDSDKEKQERKKNAFTIGEHGEAQISTDQVLLKLHQNLESKERLKGIVDGTVTIREASDYYTNDELVQFKKTKGNNNKKRRLRSKQISEQLLPLDVTENPEVDLGSRNQRENRLKSKKLEEVVNVLERRDNYNKAVEKAEIDSKLLFEEEEEEDELYKSLTRKLVQKERKKERRSHSIASRKSSARNSQ